MRVWFGDRLSFLAQSVEVERNCLSHVMFHFFMGPASRNTSREIWRVGRKACFCRLDDNQVFFHDFNPGCFRILFNVPGARSSPGFPGTVTKPSLTGCFYCRWLPRVRTKTQPSASSIRITSRIFTEQSYDERSTASTLDFSQSLCTSGCPGSHSPCRLAPEQLGADCESERTGRTRIVSARTR